MSLATVSSMQHLVEDRDAPEYWALTVAQDPTSIQHDTSGVMSLGVKQTKDVGVWRL